MVQHQQILERKGFGPNEMIFREGDPGNVAYVIQAGSVEIFRSRADGDDVLGTVGPGGIFGEMALIDDKPRMASARSIDQTTVIVISRMTFRKKLEKTDPFVRGLLNIMVGNIRSIADRRKQ